MCSSDRSLPRAQALRVLAAGVASLSALSGVAFAADPPATSVPADVAWTKLTSGNARFVAGAMTNQNEVIERRLALTGGQAPFASLLACSDSRVAPELLFDQRVGDIFVARNAGNFVTDAVLGTLEYGYSVLGVKLIVVLGHESCGAISATYDALKNAAPLPPHLDAIENGIRAGIAPVVAAHGTKNAAAAANAKAQAAKLSRSSVLAAGIEKGDLKILAAEYHLGSGIVSTVH